MTGNTQKELSVAFSAPASTTKVQLSIPGNRTQFVRELAAFAASTGVTAYPLWTDVISNDRPTTIWKTCGDGFWSFINRADSNVIGGRQVAAGPSGHDRAVSPRTADF